MLIALALSGLAVGLLVGLTGVGGGAVMTPILVLLIGVSPVTAVGTDVVFACVTKLFGAWVHGTSGSVDWQVVRRLCLGSLPAAVVSVLFLHNFEQSQWVNQIIVYGLGGALLLSGGIMLFRDKIHGAGRQRRLAVPESFKRHQPELTVFAGVVLGTMVTLTSVGAGALGAAMLLFLYPLRLTPVKLVGTDIAHAIPLTLVAGAGHLALGNVDGGMLGPMLLGSVPGIIAGSLLAKRLSARWLRTGIALILLALGARMLVA